MKLLLLFGLLFSQAAGAQEKPPLPRVVADASGGPAAAEAFRKLPVCSLAPDGKHLLVEPCRPAPANSFAQRRSVPQTILRMPSSSANGPSTRPPALMPLPVPPAPVAGPGIQPLRQCDAGGCRDANGTRYQGSGGVVLDPSGRACRTDGHWVQC